VVPVAAEVAESDVVELTESVVVTSVEALETTVEAFCWLETTELDEVELTTAGTSPAPASVPGVGRSARGTVPDEAELSARVLADEAAEDGDVGESWVVESDVDDRLSPPVVLTPVELRPVVAETADRSEEPDVVVVVDSELSDKELSVRVAVAVVVLVTVELAKETTRLICLGT